jgi:mono/diheme cytochrome c family protein
MPTLRPALIAMACGLACLAQQKEPPFSGTVKTYYAASCARCHGADGSGRNSSGGQLPDSGYDFTQLKAAKKDPRKWAAIILDGKDKMPSYKGILTQEQALDMAQNVLHPFSAH